MRGARGIGEKSLLLSFSATQCNQKFVINIAADNPSVGPQRALDQRTTGRRNWNTKPATRPATWPPRPSENWRPSAPCRRKCSGSGNGSSTCNATGNNAWARAGPADRITRPSPIRSIHDVAARPERRHRTVRPGGAAARPGGAPRSRPRCCPGAARTGSVPAETPHSGGRGGVGRPFDIYHYKTVA